MTPIARASRCLLQAVLACALLASARLAAAAEPAGRIIDVRAAHLYTEVSGSGVPVLFLHGGLRYFDSSFALQKPYFSAFRTVIGVDQRGHGHSPDNDQPFSYVEMADDTAALLQKLGMGPVDVVGHSDGGNVGLVLAHRHPELVRRLVVSGANIHGGHPGVLGLLRSLVAPAERVVDDTPSPLRDEYASVSPEGAKHWPALVEKSNALWATRTVLTTEELHAIRIPVLVMAGDHDDISLEETIAIYRSLPKGQLAILPASGHETMIDRPDEFNRLTRAFLEVPVAP